MIYILCLKHIPHSLALWWNISNKCCRFLCGIRMRMLCILWNCCSIGTLSMLNGIMCRLPMLGSTHSNIIRMLSLMCIGNSPIMNSGMECIHLQRMHSRGDSWNNMCHSHMLNSHKDILRRYHYRRHTVDNTHFSKPNSYRWYCSQSNPIL